MPGFYCPRCDKRFIWSEEIKGNTFDCGNCGASIIVPEDVVSSTPDVEMVAPLSDDESSKDPMLRGLSPLFDPAEYSHLPTIKSWRKTSEATFLNIKTPLIIILIIIPTLHILRMIRDEINRPIPVPARKEAPKVTAVSSPPTNQANSRPLGRLNLDPPLDADKEKKKATEPLFELSEGLFIRPAISGEESPTIKVAPADFDVSIRYKIRPSENVIVAQQYAINLSFDGESQHLPFENMNREGLMQATVHPLREKTPTEVKAWVEWKNPEKRGPEIRVSNVIALAPGEKLPDMPPPPLDDPNAPAVIIHRELAPDRAMIESSKKKKGESDETLTNEEIDELIKSLPTLDKWKVRAPLDRLEKMPVVESKRAAVNLALKDLFSRSEHSIRMDIVKIWSTWGTDVVLPELRLALENENDFLRAEAVRMIGERQLASALGPMVDLARSGKNRVEIEDAFVKFGKSAEESVWPMLQGSSNDVVKLGLRILRRIGTEKSLPKIQPFRDDADPFVRVEADNTFRDIQRRTM